MTAIAPTQLATRSVTQTVAEFVTSRPFGGASDQRYTRATRAFIDTVGVAIAARQEPSFNILSQTLGIGNSTGGEATLLPTRERTSAANAALLNGTAGHALD